MDAGLYIPEVSLQLFRQEVIDIKCNEKALERMNVINLLGICLDSHLDRTKHVTKLLFSCYGVLLAVLRKIRHLAPFKS